MLVPECLARNSLDASSAADTSPAACSTIMQAQKEIPADLSQCKDKFLVQVKGLEAGEV